MGSVSFILYKYKSQANNLVLDSSSLQYLNACFNLSTIRAAKIINTVHERSTVFFFILKMAILAQIAHLDMDVQFSCTKKCC